MEVRDRDQVVLVVSLRGWRWCWTAGAVHGKWCKVSTLGCWGIGEGSGGDGPGNFVGKC